MIDGFSQPLALILFPLTQMPPLHPPGAGGLGGGGVETLMLTGRDGPVGECRGSLVFGLRQEAPLAPMVRLLAQLRNCCRSE